MNLRKDEWDNIVVHRFCEKTSTNTIYVVLSNCSICYISPTKVNCIFTCYLESGHLCLIQRAPRKDDRGFWILSYCHCHDVISKFMLSSAILQKQTLHCDIITPLPSYLKSVACVVCCIPKRRSEAIATQFLPVIAMTAQPLYAKIDIFKTESLRVHVLRRI